MNVKKKRAPRKRVKKTVVSYGRAGKGTSKLVEDAAIDLLVDAATEIMASSLWVVIVRRKDGRPALIKSGGSPAYVGSDLEDLVAQARANAKEWTDRGYGPYDLVVGTVSLKVREEKSPIVLVPLVEED